MDQRHDSPRELVILIEREFAGLIESLRQFVNTLAPELLYQRPPAVTIGEHLLRSAAAIEQTCGGLTANLWDDPFEWTLPESLANAQLINEYLAEVDSARQTAFASIVSDAELTKFIAAPSGEPQQLVSLLLETLVKAGDHRGRALATRKMLSASAAQGFII